MMIRINEGVAIKKDKIGAYWDFKCRFWINDKII